jgi:hypothetical protein
MREYLYCQGKPRVERRFQVREMLEAYFNRSKVLFPKPKGK